VKRDFESRIITGGFRARLLSGRVRVGFSSLLPQLAVELQGL